ncbi:MAG TPA: hypothetical protein DEB06_06520 [Phycisphaerales bacterium]|nr:hypothetical protein [Phycisphaerales bacterium]
MGTAPVVDGTMSDAEWAGSLKIERHGQTVWLRADAERVYIGIRGAGPAITTVCIDEPERVRVLHASAALGEVSYDRKDGALKLRGPVEYARQPAGDAEGASAAREAHFAAHGWTGSVVGVGAPGVTELAISREALGLSEGKEQSFPLALSLLSMAGGKGAGKFTLPDGLSDATVDRRMQAGMFLESAAFTPESWAVLTIGE